MSATSFFFRLGPTDLQVKGEMTQYDPYIEGPRNHPFLVLGSNFNPQDTPRSTVQPRGSWVQGPTRPSVQRSVKLSCVKWRWEDPSQAFARMIFENSEATTTGVKTCEVLNSYMGTGIHEWLGAGKTSLDMLHLDKVFKSSGWECTLGSAACCVICQHPFDHRGVWTKTGWKQEVIATYRVVDQQLEYSGVKESSQGSTYS